MDKWTNGWSLGTLLTLREWFSNWTPWRSFEGPIFGRWAHARRPVGWGSRSFPFILLAAGIWFIYWVFSSSIGKKARGPKNKDRSLGRKPWMEVWALGLQLDTGGGGCEWDTGTIWRGDSWKSRAWPTYHLGVPGVRTGSWGEGWPDSKLSFQLSQIFAPESQTSDRLFAEATAFSSHNYKHNVCPCPYQESNSLALRGLIKRDSIFKAHFENILICCSRFSERQPKRLRW